MNRMKKGAAVLLAVCIAVTGVLAGCGSSRTDTSSTGGTSVTSASLAESGKSSAEAGSSAGTETSASAQKAPQIQGLTYQSTVKLDYATQYQVYKYKGGYALIQIEKEGKFLLVPEGKKAPAGLNSKITVIQQPKNIYLAATASMALFASMNALDTVTMTSLDEKGWSFDAPKKALKSGKMKYAGKYNQPDYEMLLGNNCDLAIESTMIYHTPEVQEMIKDLGIPVLVDRSSYESNPLGRTEWIKLYGVMTGHEKEADAFFAEQEKKIESIRDFKNTEKTVAFFYISTDGKAVVRSSTDYVPTMIEMAGGRYIFKNATDKSGSSSVPMTVEKFYDIASDADYIVYNGSIDSSVKTLKDLLQKDPVLKNMKAVKNGRCWITGSSMYQRTDIVGNMILDFHRLFTEDSPSDLQFLTKLQ